METQVKHYNGEWVVFVDDDPKFSFIYREEANAVRDMIEALIETRGEFIEFYGDAYCARFNRTYRLTEEALKKVGVDI